MDEVLFRAVAERVGGYLDAVDRLAMTADEAPVLIALRAEVLRLTAAWRALLGGHRRSVGGTCVGCRQRAWQGNAFCVVWRTAHAYFVAGVPLPHVTRGESP